ncbi:MAG TPA: response regulator [Pseudobacteroides sp.]|uniref:LytR/AlgR family response regulator transcription factor n=1 Tax=Pseudobacteroides sp. TaxID=1968840 RepID=UPI002F938077
MMVDDEEWCLKELSDILYEVDGIEIIGTYSIAVEAMEAAIREGTDIIFVDVQMPGMSGLDLALALKRRLKMVYIVLMSEKECFARNGFDIGVEDYILKPLRKDRILKALERAG